MSLQEDRANPGLQAALAISAHWTKRVETITGMNSDCQRLNRQCQVAQARCVAAAELLATGCNLDRKNPLGRAEGLTHQIRNVGFAILTSGFGGLHEHGLHTKRLAICQSRYIFNIVELLLATHLNKTPAKLMV